MPRFVTKKVTVTMLDGTEHIHTHVGGSVTSPDIVDGVLRLYYKSGDYADLEHVRSYPMTSVAYWEAKGW